MSNHQNERAVENYKEWLDELDEERLAQEFSDRIGNETRDYDWLMAHKGKQAVKDQLLDHKIVSNIRNI